MLELILDDCMNVMKKYDDNYFDLAIVDPPYREKNNPTKEQRLVKSLKRHKKYGDFAPTRLTKKKVEMSDWKKPKQDFFDELFRVSKNQIIWGANNYYENLPNTNCFVVWNKHNPLPQYSDCELAWTSFKKPAKVFDYSIHKTRSNNIKNGGIIHPTQKPVDLYTWLLKTYSEKGQKILDTHLGSGSIAIACHYFGVDLVGVEINKEYLNKTKERIELITKQTNLF
tara:strand:+ start:88 stop:765 length:678 start_codon:yes stop_codon:yes gene_type:complete